MASRRMIDPSIWQSETFSALTPEQRLLFIGLFSNADDQGRLRGHPSLIRSLIFPYDNIPIDKIENDLLTVESLGSILIYSDNDRSYIQLVGWWNYQSPQWAAPSKMPAPEGWFDRCRYRKGGKVIDENWDGSLGKALPKPLPKPLPKALPGPIVESSIGIDIGLNKDGAGKTEKTSISEEKVEDSPPPPKENKKSTPQKKKKRPAKPKKPVPPAVKVYREVAHRFPDKACWEMISSAVGEKPENLEFWRQVVQNYIACGWNKLNIKTQLEFYNRREIPAMNGANNGPQGANQTSPTSSFGGSRQKTGHDLNREGYFDVTTGKDVYPDLP